MFVQSTDHVIITSRYVNVIAFFTCTYDILILSQGSILFPFTYLYSMYMYMFDCICYMFDCIFHILYNWQVSDDFNKEVYIVNSIYIYIYIYICVCVCVCNVLYFTWQTFGPYDIKVNILIDTFVCKSGSVCVLLGHWNHIIGAVTRAD